MNAFSVSDRGPIAKFVIGLVFFSLVSAATASDGGGGGADRQPAIEVVADRPVPASVPWPRDVRWSGDRSLLVASQPGGVAELSGEELSRVRFVVPAPSRTGSWDRNAERLALSDDRLVVGSMAFALRWKPRDAAVFESVHDFEYIADLDVMADRLLVTGIRRDDEGRLGGDGSLAWLGRLGDPQGPFRPVLPSRDGPGVEAMENCAAMEVSAARFLADGSFLVVPGAEPGIFLYSEEGRLQRTWDSSALGILDACDMPREQSVHYSASPGSRLRWLNARRVVDEILPLPNGPAVVVRERFDDLTVWDLILLRADGTVEVNRLPVSSQNPAARLRGDVRGDRVALLIATWSLQAFDDTVEHRLVVARLAPALAAAPPAGGGASGDPGRRDEESCETPQ